MATAHNSNSITARQAGVPGLQAVFTADRRQALAQLSDVQDAGGADGVTLFRLTLESPELRQTPAHTVSLSAISRILFVFAVG